MCVKDKKYKKQQNINKYWPRLMATTTSATTTITTAAVAIATATSVCKYYLNLKIF